MPRVRLLNLHAAVLDRSAMGLAVLVMALAGSASAASAREWRFAVSIDGVNVGEHRYVVAGEGETRRVTADATFRVRLLVIDAYRWEQHVEEEWRGNCLVALASRTVEQGRTTTVAAHADGDALVVDGAHGVARIDGCAMSFAYWNPRVLEQRQLLNVQTGVPTPVQVESAGQDTIDVRGHAVAAQHYRMTTPKNRIELWYSDGGDWLAMRTTTPQGHVLAYRLL